jgi:eukaryotic-like serine/threonine-protein kinase
MAITIQCPNPACAKNTTASESISGKSVRCKSCGQSFIAMPSSDGQSPATQSGPLTSKTMLNITNIGRFQIRSKLGAGAFGTVYRAYDPHLDREVALKVPNPGTLDNPKRIERFLREAKSAANLRHPHIVPVFDAGREADRYFIASAFIAGKKLSDTIDDNGIDLREAARLTRELAEALAYAHGEGIVHRDVKPDNVMLDPEGRVHLMDFGLASRQDEESRLTNDGAIMGTPSYMSPEQAGGQQGEAKPATDQYAVGVVLYELMTGRTPFEGPPAIVIHNQIHVQPDSPAKIRSEIPRDLETICLKVLSKQPEDRYTDCQALADDLRRWLDGEPILARRLSPRERLHRWYRKNPAIAALAFSILIVLTAGAVTAAILAARATAFAELATKEAERAEAQAAEADKQRIRAEEQAKEADLQRSEVDKQRIRAEEQAKEADLQRSRAVEETKQAERSRKEAEQLSTQLLAERDRVRQQEYVADVRLAAAAWDEGRIGRMNQLLERQLPQPGTADNRGIEWMLLRRLARNSNTVIGSGKNYGFPAVSKNGERTAIPLDKGEVQIRDAKGDGVPIILKGPDPEAFGALTFHPDGKQFIGITTIGKIYVWTMTSKDAKPRLLAELPRFPNDQVPRTIELHPDGKQLLTSDRSGQVFLIDFLTGKIIWTVRDFNPLCWGARFNSKGSEIVTTWDSGLAILDPKTGNRLKSITTDKAPGRISSFRAACYAEDDRTIIIPTMSGTIHRVDVETGSFKTPIRAHDTETRWVFPVDQGKKVISAGLDGLIKVWNTATWESPKLFRSHTSGIFALASATNLGTVVTIGWDKDPTYRVWDLSKNQEFTELNLTTESGFHGAILIDQGKRLLALDGDRIRIWMVETGVETLNIAAPTKANGIISSKDGKVLVITTPSQAHLAELDGQFNLKMVGMPFKVAMGEQSVVAVSPDGKVIAANDGQGNISLLYADRSKTRFKVAPPVPNLQPSSLQFSPGGGTLLIAYRLWGFVHWDMNSKTAMSRTTSRVLTAIFNPKGDHIVAAGWEGDLTIHRLNGTVERKLTGHTHHVDCIAYSPDGKRLFSGSQDNSILVWDTSDGRELLTLRRHQDDPQQILLTPDQGRLISVAKDGKGHIWDVRTVVSDQATVEQVATDIPGTISIGDAARRVGQTVKVAFRINSAKRTPNFVFFNSHSDHTDPNTFTVLISGATDAKIANLGLKLPVTQYIGKLIVVEGKVTLYEGCPQLAIENRSKFSFVE